MVAAYHEVLVGEGKPNAVETYATSHHGWMGARARLHEEGNLKEYERGYGALADFFAANL
jgi:dienelactone hydrolase